MAIVDGVMELDPIERLSIAPTYISVDKSTGFKKFMFNEKRQKYIQDVDTITCQSVDW